MAIRSWACAESHVCSGMFDTLIMGQTDRKHFTSSLLSWRFRTLCAKADRLNGPYGPKLPLARYQYPLLHSTSRLVAHGQRIAPSNVEVVDFDLYWGQRLLQEVPHRLPCSLDLLRSAAPAYEAAEGEDKTVFFVNLQQRDIAVETNDLGVSLFLSFRGFQGIERRARACSLSSVLSLSLSLSLPFFDHPRLLLLLLPFCRVVPAEGIRILTPPWPKAANKSVNQEHEHKQSTPIAGSRAGRGDVCGNRLRLA